MNRPTLHKMALILSSALVTLFPLVAHAQSVSVIVSADDLRADFVRRGYQADVPTTWWTSNHVSTFRVYDVDDRAISARRVVMVMVYPDTATAQADLDAARVRQLASVRGFVGEGVYMVPGYGPSFAWSNVVMVQASYADLQRRYSIEVDRDMHGPLTEAEMAELTRAAPYRVDADIVAIVLNRGRIDL